MADDPSAVADPLPIPPLSPSMFSDDLTLPDGFFPFDDDNYDITFDDILISDFNSSNPIDDSHFNEFVVSDPEFTDFVSDPDSNTNLSGNQVSDVSGFLNFSSPDNSGSGEQFVTNLENSLPESRNENTVSSQGSGNCGSDGGSEGAMNMNCVSSPDSGNSVVDQKVKRELTNNNFVLKRKNESCDVNSDSRTIKYRKSNETSVISTEESNPGDEKKKARLIRNRESAQLSRQRKKHYVEELEDKVRAMHSTIQDLNARITYFAAENATLKQQMVVNNGSNNNNGVVCPPNVMYPGMAPMGYPWMPCPPYVVKSQGSQVPLVPIPRLKPPQNVSSQKSKKTDVKKSDGVSSKSKTKTKKVASISFLGLLLFILMFGGLVPIMNVKFGGVSVTDGGYSNDYNKIYNRQQPGRVLMGDDHVNGTNHRRVHERNASEPLVASLYVPRNDKLVKIDGNLIIHSVLASEKAMASREEEEVTQKEDGGLGVALDLAPAIPVPAMGRNGGRPPHMYRTSSNGQRVLSSDKENLKAKHADGKLQQWFREGLAGPMLSSGMCTEVFQFDVSAAIVPATSVANMTGENRHNSTYITSVKNRRILHGLPIPLSSSTTNITKEQMGAGNDSKHEDLHKNSSVSSMVVSVLFDPREAGDGGDVEGMMGGKSKSFSRIFVVVLLDSVKYVTYSCMLPLKGASHLVTA